MNSLHINKAYDVVKVGKITQHKSKAKGKSYSKGKIYLPDSKFIGRRHQMVEFDKIILHFHGREYKHKGYLILLLD